MAHQFFAPAVPFLTSFAQFVADNHQKWILTIGAVTLVLTVLGSSSLTFYWFLYYLVVPNVAISQNIHFDYNLNMPGVVKPTAELRFAPREITSGQEYEVFVNLEMPESPENKEAGKNDIHSRIFCNPI